MERRRRLLERTEYQDFSFDSLTELATRTWTVSGIKLSQSTFVKLQSYGAGYPVTDRVLLDRILNYYTTEFNEHQGLLEWDVNAGEEESRILWYRHDFETVPLGDLLGSEHAFPRLKSDAESNRALRAFLRTETARNVFRLDYLRKVGLHKRFQSKKEKVLDLMTAISDYRAGER